MARLSLGYAQTHETAVAWPPDAKPAALPLSASLRPWLRGHWGLLFSHADDFACYGLESDRWVVLLEQSFTAARVRPLALVSRMAAGVGSWVTQIGGASVAVMSPARHGPRVDLHARVLCDVVTRATARFVMIIDESLRLRRTFAYAAGDRLPSPLDFAALAGKLRAASRAAA